MGLIRRFCRTLSTGVSSGQYLQIFPAGFNPSTARSPLAFITSTQTLTESNNFQICHVLVCFSKDDESLRWVGNFIQNWLKFSIPAIRFSLMFSMASPFFIFGISYEFFCYTDVSINVWSECTSPLGHLCLPYILNTRPSASFQYPSKNLPWLPNLRKNFIERFTFSPSSPKRNTATASQWVCCVLKVPFLFPSPRCFKFSSAGYTSNFSLYSNFVNAQK